MSTAEAWWRLISAARWFGGKGLAAEVTAITPLPWFAPPGDAPGVRAEVASVSYADGRTEYYQLLVGYAASHPAGLATVDDPDYGPLVAFDATSDPIAMRAFLVGLRGGHPAVSWLDQGPVDPNLPTKVWAGEQSNTTICLGDAVLVKLFRKLEAGDNLDVEVLHALNGTGETPALYAVMRGALPGGGHADLGMIVERMAGVTDGWEWASAHCAAGRPITEEAEQLGATLRRVHGLLADAFGTAARPGAQVAADIEARLTQACSQVAELARYRASLNRGLSQLSGRDLTVQRIHGDFHLGQVLRSAEGWTIIDFEGEPVKTLAERRAFDNVWRDVAGMLRSFDYVRGTHPDPTSPEVKQWSEEAAAAFLNGYCGDNEPDRAALAAYQVDKAVYEVLYEVRNRPNWAHIPLEAVHDIASRAALQPTAETREY